MTASSALSDELRVALAPGTTYEDLLARQTSSVWWRALARPAIVLLVIGTAVPTMALQRVSVGLVTVSALSWSFAVAVQIVAALAVIMSARSRRADLSLALDLWFAAHLPYSLWLLVVAVCVSTTETARHDFFVLSAAVPAIWTIALLLAFCRTVLRTTVAGAWWRIAGHQSLVWTVAFGYVVWSIGGWLRIAGAIDTGLGAR